MSVILDPVEPRRVKRSGPVPSPDPAIGSVFGRLTVISAFRSEGVHKIARLRCVCGTEKEFTTLFWFLFHFNPPVHSWWRRFHTDHAL